MSESFSATDPASASCKKAELRRILADYAHRYKTWPFSRITLPGLGSTGFRFYKRASSIKAFWRKGKVVVTIPDPADFGIVANFLVDRYDEILGHKPKGPAIGPGFEYTFPDGDRIVSGINDGLRPNSVGCSVSRYSGPLGSVTYTLLTRSDARLEDEVMADLVRLRLKHILMHKSGWMPVMFKGVCDRTDILHLTAGKGVLGRPFFGLSTMGKCTARGVITLSTALALYPAWLREYIICHELAHLSHHDHSPAFHAECERLLNINFRSRLPNEMHPYIYKSRTLEKAFHAYHKNFSLPLALK